MTDERLNEIAARAEKATPGPWDVNTLAGKPFREVFCADVLIADTGCGPTITDKEIEANSEFISHARQGIPELLAEVKRLRLALEAAQADTARLDWLTAGEYKLFCHRERWAEHYSVWWTVVSRATGKALGHPLGSPRAIIDAAMETK